MSARHLRLVQKRRPPSTPAEMSSLADDAKLIAAALLALFVVAVLVSLVLSIDMPVPMVTL